MKIQPRYLLLALLLFFIELLIATYMHGNVIRSFGGDFLVVILLYCLLRGLTGFSPMAAALSVLVFSCGVEILQYFNLVDLLGLEHNRLARIIIGTRFDWWDLLAYTAGVGIAYGVDLRYGN